LTDCEIGESKIPGRILGKHVMTDYSDTNAVANGLFFYRVGVRR